MEKKSADEVLREKYEERGWFEIYDWYDKDKEEIDSLPMTEEEYRIFATLLAKLALKDRNEQFCEMYFELQRRAVYANGFYPIEELEALEKEMWSLGTGEKVEDVGCRLH